MTKHLYEWFSPTVCPFVRLFVTPFWLCSIIISSWNFEELLPITEVMSMQKVKVRGQRSRSQGSKPNLDHNFSLNSHWWWNDAHSLMLLRRGVLLILNVNSSLNSLMALKQSTKLDTMSKGFPIVFRGHSSNFKVTCWFRPALVFPNCNSSLNSLAALNWCTKLDATQKSYPIVFEVIHQISRSQRKKRHRFWPKLSVSRARFLSLS